MAAYLSRECEVIYANITSRDGRWSAAYAGPATMKAPAELLEAIAEVPEAQAMWDVLTSQNRFAFCFRLSSVKTEAGRQKNIARVVDTLSRGETPYSQKAHPALSDPKKRSSSKKSTAQNVRAIAKRSASPLVQPAKIEEGTRRSKRLKPSSLPTE